MFQRLMVGFMGALLLLPGTTVSAQERGWPRELSIESGLVTVYEPQVDDLEGDILTFRAALSYKPEGSTEPVFGAAWFSSRVEIDRESRIVHMVNLDVTDTRFPEGSEHVQAELSTAIIAGLPNWDLDFSLDSLLTSLEAAEEEIAAAHNLNMDPPDIIYRDHPALLINIDGDPVMRDIENSDYQAVINTPYPLIYDGQRYYYLNAAKDVWYKADSVNGPFAFDPQAPADITGMVDQQEAEDDSTETVTASNAPEIVVVTEPAELIVTEGEADFQPLVDDLLVLKNSDSDVFMHVSSQQYYVVLSGRWFKSGSLNGPWSFNPSDELPEAFASIPQDSSQADSLVYVAGTDEAREAVMDAQIPQTAAVRKGNVDIIVTYDGEPEFETVEGTEMSYAINTDSTILQSGQNYYLVEDAVWYIAPSPKGPWRVAESRPEEVEAIAAESPVYNVKYVYIYETTPEVVYVGYTPGYTGSYVYYSTIVYGTGWYYRPWISPYYYYPRYATWGFHMGYNPWTGWGFGLGWGWGPFRVGFYSGGYWHRHHGWHNRGRWGPGGYRPRPVHYGHNINNRRPGIGTRDNNLYRDRAQKANVAQTRDFRPSTQEAVNRPGQADRAGTRERVPSATSRPATSRPANSDVSAADLRNQVLSKESVRPSTAQNNVFTDKSGNVYRQQDGSWQKRESGNWNNVPSTAGGAASRPANTSSISKPSNTSSISRPSNTSSISRPSNTSSISRPANTSTRQSSSYQRSGSGYSSNSSLDRQNYSRQRSSSRSSQYSSHRSHRGGGGRRR